MGERRTARYSGFVSVPAVDWLGRADYGAEPQVCGVNVTGAVLRGMRCAFFVFKLSTQ